MRFRFHPKRIRARINNCLDKARIRRLTAGYNFGGYRRIYHFHIRKTGGTSLVKMFMSCRGNDPDRVWSGLGQAPQSSAIHNGLIYVGWNKRLIERGNYFLGFSHLPWDQLALPEDTFTFTCLRDPARRVISHYKMLVDLSQMPNPHPCFATEGKWLGNSFEDFLDRIPREHLLNQLYMFSNRYAIDEATERIRSLNCCVFTEQLGAGVRQLSEATGLDLQLLHKRQSRHTPEIKPQAARRLREMLDDEYQLLDQLGVSAAPSSRAA